MLDDPDAGLAVPLDYVADEIDLSIPVARTIANLDDAADAFHDYLVQRLGAIWRGAVAPVGIMLSGGIDSILLAVIATELGLKPTAVTVEVAGENSDDVERAARLSDHLGIDHRVVSLNPSDILHQCARCASALGVDELWEITAAIPILAAFDELDARGVAGPVLTGTGADAILAGGKKLTARDLSSDAASKELNTIVVRQVQVNFSRDRLVPDFYSRLLGASDARFILAYQTFGAWEIAARLRPGALWVERGGVIYDKACLRVAAEQLGTPVDLVWTRKEPIQRSSGLVRAIGSAAREALAGRRGHRTYTDPRTEDDELAYARLAICFADALLRDVRS